MTVRLRCILDAMIEKNETDDVDSSKIHIMRTVDLKNLCQCFWEGNGEDQFYTELFTLCIYGRDPAMYVSLDWYLGQK